MAKRRGTAILIHLDKPQVKALDARVAAINEAVKATGARPHMTRTSTAEVILKEYACTYAFKTILRVVMHEPIHG